MKPGLPAAPHIGTLLNKHMRLHRYYKSALARDIGVNYKTVVNIMRRPDIKVSFVWNICYALNYNFFVDLANLLPPEMPSAPTAKDVRIAELEEQLRQMAAERDTLQRIVDVLRPR